MKRSEVEKHLGEFVAVELIDGTKVAGFLAQGDPEHGEHLEKCYYFCVYPKGAGIPLGKINGEIFRCSYIKKIRGGKNELPNIKQIFESLS